MNILVIPDSHAHPHHNNDRFLHLGRLILDRRPDIVIDIGDSADMPSLCSYDRGTIRAEGMRYTEDLRAYREAQELLWAPLREYNEMRSRNKKAQWLPHRIKCVGNHENRIERAALEDPKLHGHLSLADLEEHKYYDEVYPFCTPVVIESIAFQHYFTSGVMGNPVGGLHAAASLVRKNHMSSVCGHAHTRDYWESIRPDGNRVFGLVVGCYVDYEPNWTKEYKRWWSGVVMLNDVRDGQAEPEFIGIDTVRRAYA